MTIGSKLRIIFARVKEPNLPMDYALNVRKKYSMKSQIIERILNPVLFNKLNSSLLIEKENGAHEKYLIYFFNVSVYFCKCF